MHAWLLALVLVVAIPLSWAWWRAPRRGKHLTPMLGGSGQPIQFRPGPPLLPEHDAAPAFEGSGAASAPL